MPTNLPQPKKPVTAPVKNEKYVLIENIVTLLLSVTLVLGLAYVFHSWHCLWGLLLLVNLSSSRVNDNDAN
jgi:fatty acid desaturase